jgi:hypothetical protein
MLLFRLVRSSIGAQRLGGLALAKRDLSRASASSITSSEAPF